MMKALAGVMLPKFASGLSRKIEPIFCPAVVVLLFVIVALRVVVVLGRTHEGIDTENLRTVGAAFAATPPKRAVVTKRLVTSAKGVRRSVPGVRAILRYSFVRRLVDVLRRWGAIEAWCRKPA